MKQFLFLLLFFCTRAQGQQVRTILPAQPVVEGTAFQVQYIITNGAGFLSASTPEFQGCHIVSGPNYYKGIGTADGASQLIQNIAYTVVADKAGSLTIPAIRVKFSSGLTVEGAATNVIVQPPPNASYTTHSSYTDREVYTTRASRLEELIRTNLFLRLDVSKKSVYAGEPLEAKFTLYSRLQSSSEAERSPSFYGFSIVDMLNVNQAHTAVEVVNGKVFNTAILRKVQLFPVQAGLLTIDPMLVSNEIEFDDSISHKKERVVRELASVEVRVVVKPLPAPIPAGFSGMVGDFKISAELARTRISLNEEGLLKVVISGSGNYIQMASPTIRWPEGLEPLDPTFSDELDERSLPVSGSRTYSYSFTADSMGSYILAPVVIHFFDPASGRYVRAATDSLKFEVVPAPAKKRFIGLPVNKSQPWLWLGCGIIGISFLFFVLSKRRKRKVVPAQQPRPQLLYMEEEAWRSSETPKEYCSGLLKILKQISEGDLSAERLAELNAIRFHCQEVLYTNREEQGGEEFRQRVRSFLENAGHSAYL